MVARQSTARTDAAKEEIARSRAKQLLAAMTPGQKLEQLAGSEPEILPELPNCYGARHISGIASLGIPTFRITNGPVGVGQNDCVAASVKDQVRREDEDSMWLPHSHPTSARATALPSALAVAASFDPQVASSFGGVIAEEMNNLALHVLEAPGVNLARLPLTGRNFEYFGEDPLLSGTMAVAETKAVQKAGVIAQVKHFIANEQETNRFDIREIIDDQVLRELYAIPFEMSVKDGRVASVMCSYNYINGLQACDNKPLLTGLLRDEWGFRGYVQTDFFALKSSASSLVAGTDHEMPTPYYWTRDKINAALNDGSLQASDIDTALERRYVQMFKAGIFDRKLQQTPIDFKANGKIARDIGVRSAVLMQDNGALPIASTARTILLVGKASQPYAQQAVAGGSILGKVMGAGGGSSDVVPDYTVPPIDGIRNALTEMGRADALVKIILVDDDNSSATIDGRSATFRQALAEMAGADSVVVMAGTVAEEGADRATFRDKRGFELAAAPASGTSLDWYVAEPKTIATLDPAGNRARSSGTVAMLKAIMTARSTTMASMAQKTVLVLKDNAGVELDPALLGAKGPSILEVWFPGQEDGNIVADLLFGRAVPSGRLPVTYPVIGRGFLDSITAQQFPGVLSPDGREQTVTYSEGLAIGYRWYDANISGKCAPVAGANPCVAFPFGHGLSYTRFDSTAPSLAQDGADRFRVSLTVRNTGARSGSQVVQAYLSLPDGANALGLPQPPRRLVGWERVDLMPEETRTVTVTVDAASTNHPLSIWNTAEKRWQIVPGRYEIFIGTSSAPADLMHAGTVTR